MTTINSFNAIYDQSFDKRCAGRRCCTFRGGGLCRRSLGIGHNFIGARVCSCSFLFCDFFLLFSHAEPSRSGPTSSGWPARVTCREEREGLQTASPRRKGRDTRLLRTPSRFPREERGNAYRKCQNTAQKPGERAHVRVCVSETSGWKGWQVSGRLLCFCIFSLSHLRDSLCESEAKATTDHVDPPPERFCFNLATETNSSAQEKCCGGLFFGGGWGGSSVEEGRKKSRETKLTRV